MHISKLSLINYRNFPNSRFLFNKGVNTIIGENGSGKTNVFRAIRLLIDSNMRRSAARLEEIDFNRGIGEWRGHWIIISLEFEELSPDEAIQSLFLHNAGDAADVVVSTATYSLIFRPNSSIRKKLSDIKPADKAMLQATLDSISIGDYETVITGRSDADFNDPAIYKELVGDFDKVEFPEEIDGQLLGSRVNSHFNLYDEISFTFIKALRDVISDFQNHKKNPLLSLLKLRSGEINKTEFSAIADKVIELNSDIENLTDVSSVRKDIHETIKGAVGDTYSPEKLAIKSSLSSEAEELFQSLILHVGESGDGHEGPIQDLSLGGANLIFLTLKLLEFKYQQQHDSFANFLLIEEPEAHIHTHIQKTLFDNVKFPNTQIIYSTHSTHVSDVSNVESMNIIGRGVAGSEVYQPSTGLKTTNIRAIQRYLDAIRSNLLFSKSVILVEGDAEEFLIPVLIKNVLGVSLDEIGISLVNVRSTGFQNVAQLFDETRIRKRCAIITDVDEAFIDTSPSEDDSDAIRKAKVKAIGSAKSGAERKEKLDLFIGSNPWIESFLAPHTFEVDFITAGNAQMVVDLLGDIYTDQKTINVSKRDLLSKDLSLYGTRILTIAANQGKGWFALQLADSVDSHAYIPDYVGEALAFAHQSLSASIGLKIINYRTRQNLASQVRPSSSSSIYRSVLKRYKNGKVDFSTLHTAFSKMYPDDSARHILANF